MEIVDLATYDPVKSALTGKDCKLLKEASASETVFSITVVVSVTVFFFGYCCCAGKPSQWGPCVTMKTHPRFAIFKNNR